MDREKAVAGQSYIVDGVEFMAVNANDGCFGCTGYKSNILCSDFPICSDAGMSVVFVRVEK